jgi:hypothetical protein
MSPVEVDVLARGDFGDRWVLADWSPDLSLELARRNIIAEEGVVCDCQYRCLHIFLTCTYSSRSDPASLRCYRNVQARSRCGCCCATPSG